MYSELSKELDTRGVKLIAVSKTKPDNLILHLYNKEHRDFGENRIQELSEKQDRLPKDIRWHMIGHLQRNKVKYITAFVYMIHSVDSFELMDTINRRAGLIPRKIKILLQFKIGKEKSKSGMTIEEASSILDSDEYKELDHIEICGVMGMASFVEHDEVIRKEFRQLKHYFDVLKSRFFSDDPFFKEISMGMSGDYKIAIEEGSTMVRIGSLIFGPRG